MIANSDNQTINDDSSEYHELNNENKLSDNNTPDGKLFSEDWGTLSYEARKVLVQLLRGPTIEEELHPILWGELILHEKAIRMRLGDLFLRLVIDSERGVAFIRQAETDNIQIPQLLRTSPLTFIDSVLLLHLRENLMRSDNAAEKAVVTEDELVEYLNIYQKSNLTDSAGFRNKTISSIKKMRSHNILRKRRNEQESWEINPILRLLITPETVKEMTIVYKKLAQENSDLCEDSVLEEEGE